MGTFLLKVIGSSRLVGVSSMDWYELFSAITILVLAQLVLKVSQARPNSDINIEQGIDWTGFLKTCECPNSNLGKSDLGKSHCWWKK